MRSYYFERHHCMCKPKEKKWHDFFYFFKLLEFWKFNGALMAQGENGDAEMKEKHSRASTINFKNNTVGEGTLRIIWFSKA